MIPFINRRKITLFFSSFGSLMRLFSPRERRTNRIKRQIGRTSWSLSAKYAYLCKTIPKPITDEKNGLRRRTLRYRNEFVCTKRRQDGQVHHGLDEQDVYRIENRSAKSGIQLDLCFQRYAL